MICDWFVLIISIAMDFLLLFWVFVNAVSEMHNL